MSDDNTTVDFGFILRDKVPSVGEIDMATFFVYGIQWDPNVDGKVVDISDLPTYALVWLPEYVAGGDPVDDAEAVLDKLTDDFHGILDYQTIVTIEHEDGDTSNHPCRARPLDRSAVVDIMAELQDGPPERIAEAVQCMGSGCLFEDFNSAEQLKGAMIVLSWIRKFQRDLE